MTQDVCWSFLSSGGDALVQGEVLVLLDGDQARLMPAMPPELLNMAKVTSAIDGEGDPNLARVRLPESQEQEVLAARTAAEQRLGQPRF